jgi:hypothetical protein
MSFNEAVVVILAAVALIIALVEEARAQAQSLTHWAIVLLAVAIIWLMLAPS